MNSFTTYETPQDSLGALDGDSTLSGELAQNPALAEWLEAFISADDARVNAKDDLVPDDPGRPWMTVTGIHTGTSSDYGNEYSDWMQQLDDYIDDLWGGGADGDGYDDWEKDHDCPIASADGRVAKTSGGTEEQTEQLMNILEAIVQFGNQISGSFLIGEQTHNINLADTFSIGANGSLRIDFGNLPSGSGFTGRISSSATLITIDMNEVTSSASVENRSVLHEMVVTVIHELIHHFGHVQDIAGLIPDHTGVEPAAVSLANQLIAIVEANGVDLTRDRTNCG